MQGTAPRGPVGAGTCPHYCPFPRGSARTAQVYVGQSVPAPEEDGGGGRAQVGRHLSSYSSTSRLPHLSIAQPSLLGEAERREEGVELPPNRSQTPTTTPLLNSGAPSTDWVRGQRGPEDRNKIDHRMTERFISLPWGPTDPHTHVETTRAEGVLTGALPHPRGTKIYMCTETGACVRPQTCRQAPTSPAKLAGRQVQM